MGNSKITLNRLRLLIILPCSVLTILMLFSCKHQAQKTPDKSLQLKGYLDLGIPNPGLSWTSGEYRTTAEILKQLADEDAALLPRFKSPKSGRLFSRIIDTLNFNYWINETNSPELFALNLLMAMIHIQNIQKLYLVPREQGMLFGEELAELINITYFLADRANTYSEIGVFGPPDADSSGRSQIKKNLSSIIQVSLATLEDRIAMEESVRERLSRYVKNGISRNFFRLTPIDKHIVRYRIHQLIAGESNIAVKSALEHTLELI